MSYREFLPLQTRVPIDEIESSNDCSHIIPLIRTRFRFNIYNYFYDELPALPTSPNRYCAQLMLPSGSVQVLLPTSSPAAPAPM